MGVGSVLQFRPFGSEVSVDRDSLLDTLSGNISVLRSTGSGST